MNGERIEIKRRQEQRAQRREMIESLEKGNRKGKDEKGDRLQYISEEDRNKEKENVQMNQEKTRIKIEGRQAEDRDKQIEEGRLYKDQKKTIGQNI